MHQISEYDWAVAPRNPALRRALLVALLWLAGLFMVALIGSDSPLAPLIGDLLLTVTALIILRQVLHPAGSTDEPEKLYEVHSALAITFVVSLGILLFSGLLFPTLFPASGAEFPAKPGTLLLFALTIRSFGLIQQATRLGEPKRGVTWWGISVTLFALFVSSWSGSLEPYALPVIGFMSIVLAPLLFFRGLRNEWVIRLRRESKYRLAGLSFLLVLSSNGWFIVLLNVTTGDVESFLHVDLFSVLFAYLVALISFSWGSGILIRTLTTLPTARAMDRRQNEVASLSSLGMMMLDEFDRDRLIRTSLDTAAAVTGSQYVWIRFFDERNPRDEEMLTGFVEPVPEEVIDRFHQLSLPGDRGETIGDVGRTTPNIALYNAAVAGQGPNGEQSILQGMIAVVPVSPQQSRRGALYLFTRETRGYDRDDRLMLETVAAQISLTVEHADLVQRSIERERLESEMQIAREAQSRLLPENLPSLPGVELYALSQPASLVGGDYYDTIEFRDGTIGCIVADVSGKGAGAALYMGMVKGVVRGLSREVEGPVDFLTRMNRALYRNIDPRFFVTMSVARILPDQQVVELARAGHTPGVVVRPQTGSVGSSEVLEIVPKGIGLALAGDEIFSRTIHLERFGMEPGEVLALFSDGLTEARDDNGKELEQEGFSALLQSVIAEEGNSSLQGVAGELVRRISTFSGNAAQHDDITLLLVRWSMPHLEGHGDGAEVVSDHIKPQDFGQ